MPHSVTIFAWLANFRGRRGGLLRTSHPWRSQGLSVRLRRRRAKLP
jgi:hypothetical protein